MQRRLILAMVVLEALLLRLMYQVTLYPILAIVVGGYALLRGPQLPASRRRQSIYSFLLLLSFVALWQLIPFQAAAIQGLRGSEVTYVFAQYFIALQVLDLFFRKERMSALIPFYGALAVVCAGNVYIPVRLSVVFGAFSLLFIGLSVAYFRSRMTPVARRGQRPPRRAWVPVAALLILTGLASAGLSGLVYQHRYRATELLVDLFGTRTARAGPGYTDDATLGSIVRLREEDLGDQTTLRVFSKDPPGYLRGKAFDYYNIRSEWRDMSTPTTLAPVAPPEGLADLRPEQNYFELATYEGVSWRRVDVWPTRYIMTGMFSPEDAAVVAAPDVETLTLDTNGATESGEITGGIHYSWFVPQNPLPEAITPRNRWRFKRVPASIDPRVHDLARRIFAGRKTPSEKMDAVVDYFRANYRYEVGIQIPDGADPLTHFLLVRPAAHCEYFAAGAALLLRIGDVPTRYVTGFVVEEWNPFGQYWMARNRNAHAWVEAYDDETGWQIVEATPASGLPSPADVNVADHLADYARFRVQELQVAAFLRGTEGVMAWLGARGRGLLAIAMSDSAGMLALKACVLVLFVRYLLRRVWRRRPRRMPEAPLVRALHALLAQADAGLRKRGLTREHTETLHQFARRVGEAAPECAGAADWYDAYAAVRYGGEAAESDLTRLRRLLPGQRKEPLPGAEKARD